MTTPDTVMAEMGAAVERGRAGDRAGARLALEDLWNRVGADGDPLHRVSIAHFAADLQDAIDDELMWDERALAALPGLTDGRLQEFHAPLQVQALLPSLHLNLADAHRRAGHATEARRHLDAAVATVGVLPDDEYGRMIRAGIDRNREALTPGAAPTRPSRG